AKRETPPICGRRRRRARRDPNARSLQESILRRDQSVSVATAHGGSGGGGRRILQRQDVYQPDQHQFRTQEIISGRYWSTDWRDGDIDVLERAESPIQSNIVEDGAEAGGG